MRKHILVFLLLQFFFFLAASAKEKADTVVSDLPAVTVTAVSYDKEIIPSQKLHGEELQRLNALSIADALRFFAGVQLKDYGGVGGIKTINIRSMGTNHVGVYYDGVELSNAQNGQVDLGMYSLDNIEAISLHNGQKSGIFQPAKDFNSAGSVYITTRRPEFSDEKPYNLRVKLKTGSFDLINPSAVVDLALSDKVSASISAEWLSSSGKYKFRYRRRAVRTGEIVYDTTAVRQNGDVRATRLEASLYGRFENGEWTAKAYNYTSNRGVPGAIVNNVWRRGERIGDNNSFIQGKGIKRFSQHYSTQLLAKYAYYLTSYVNKDTTVLMIDNIYRQKELYLSSSHLFDILPEWRASASYDFQWNSMDAQMYGFVYPRRSSSMASVATSYHHNWFSCEGSLVYTYIHDTTKLAEAPKDKSVWTPALFLSVRPWTNYDFSIRAFWKKSFRMPTFNDLYYAEMGNSKLEPEHTQQWNLGVNLNRIGVGSFLHSYGFSVDAYHNRVKDKIIAYPKGAQFRWTMLNLGKVDIKGIDVTAFLTLTPHSDVTVTGKVQYTYQKAIDVTSPADNYYGHQIPYIPWHSGSAICQAQWKAWGLNYSFIYTGERYNQQENIVYNHTQPWYTSDLSLLRDIRLKPCNLRVMLEVNNLFSQDYDVILNYPMPKRNYRLTLSLDY